MCGRVIGQVLDGSVPVFGIILTARIKWVAQRGEQKSRDGVCDDDVGGGGGGTMMVVMPGSDVQDNK